MSSASEIATKIKSCHLNGIGASDKKIIAKAPHANQTVVSAIVSDSMTMQRTTTMSQNHGKLFKMSIGMDAV